MFRHRFCRRARYAALASSLAFGFGASTGWAQPAGQGPGGPGGPHGGDPLSHVIEQYKSQLALNSSQQQMWDGAVALTKQARETGRGYRQEVHTAMQTELAKAEPDLAAVAAIADDAHAKAQALRRQVRDEWLKLYATFTPAQKTVVRDALQARMQRFGEMRGKWGRG